MAPPEVAPEINAEKEGVVGETMGFPTLLFSQIPI